MRSALRGVAGCRLRRRASRRAPAQARQPRRTSTQVASIRVCPEASITGSQRISSRSAVVLVHRETPPVHFLFTKSTSAGHLCAENCGNTRFLPDIGQEVAIPHPIPHDKAVPADRTLVDHLVATTELTAAEADRVVEDVLAFHAEPVEDYVRRRHAELKTHGARNPEIFAHLAEELAHPRRGRARAQRAPAAPDHLRIEEQDNVRNRRVRRRPAGGAAAAGGAGPAGAPGLRLGGCRRARPGQGRAGCGWRRRPAGCATWPSTCPSGSPARSASATPAGRPTGRRTTSTRTRTSTPRVTSPSCTTGSSTTLPRCGPGWRTPGSTWPPTPTPRCSRT